MQPMLSILVYYSLHYCVVALSCLALTFFSAMRSIIAMKYPNRIAWKLFTVSSLQKQQIFFFFFFFAAAFVWRSICIVRNYNCTFSQINELSDGTRLPSTHDLKVHVAI